jgi:hypothetical protein
MFSTFLVDAPQPGASCRLVIFSAAGATMRQTFAPGGAKSFRH